MSTWVGEAILRQRPAGQHRLKLQRLLNSVAAREPRQEKRLPFKNVVRFRLDKGPFQRARLEDVSEGGLRVVLPCALRQSTRVQILYSLPASSNQYWVEGVARWCREVRAEYWTGVEVDFLSNQDEVPFRSLVEWASRPPRQQTLAAQDEDWFLSFLDDSCDAAPERN